LTERAAVALLVIVSTLTLAVSGGAFSVDLAASGTLDAWISGWDLVASIEGEIRLTGAILVDGRLVRLEAEGDLFGFGVRGITTIASEGWLGYTAQGATADGEPIEICGLLYGKRETLLPLRAGDLLVGVHRAAIRFRNETHRFCGAFSGTVDGGLEPAETWGTIQFSGTGVARLDDDPAAAQTIPLDHPALPIEFLEYVARLDLGL